VTTLYWARYLFLLLLIASVVWTAWLATADVRGMRRRRR
jgi:hypothetical protein